jgi:hypothetical protein
MTGSGYEDVFLRLIYDELRLRLWLPSLPENCSTLHLENRFWVSSISYYSPQAAVAPREGFLLESDQLQPALLAYDFSDRDVSLETWQSWLDGEVDMPCWEAWEQLPEEVVLPTVPALTPTPTATATPTPAASATPRANAGTSVLIPR